MKKRTAKTWNALIEEIALRYEKQWDKVTKENWQKFLHLVLKRKYELKNLNVSLTKEETRFFKKTKPVSSGAVKDKVK